MFRLLEVSFHFLNPDLSAITIDAEVTRLDTMIIGAEIECYFLSSADVATYVALTWQLARRHTSCRRARRPRRWRCPPLKSWAGAALFFIEHASFNCSLCQPQVYFLWSEACCSNQGKNFAQLHSLAGNRKFLSQARRSSAFLLLLCNQTWLQRQSLTHANREVLPVLLCSTVYVQQILMLFCYAYTKKVYKRSFNSLFFAQERGMYN